MLTTLRKPILGYDAIARSIWGGELALTLHLFTFVVPDDRLGLGGIWTGGWELVDPM
jgi:hypothetical protein